MGKRLMWLARCVALVALTVGVAGATGPGLSDDVVKIGVLTDMTGLLRGMGGQGTQVSVEMAVRDFGGKVLGKPIQVVGADHLNKADVAAAKAREWFEIDKVDMIIGLHNSACALAAQQVGAEKKRITIVTGAATDDLTNNDCSPYGIHYTYDDYALAQVIGKTMARSASDSWFFITVDYIFGYTTEKNTADIVESHGGKVLGRARHPQGTTDFSPYLLQAQKSGAKVIGFASAGGDLTNAVKQAMEMGLDQKGQRLVGLLVFDNDIKTLGLRAAQGMQFASGFYWDRDEQTRAFAKRFGEAYESMPNMDQAGAYSATMNYLKAIQTAGTDDPDTVMATLRSMDISDFFAVHGTIRVDGQMTHDMYLMEVKKPEESKAEWDLLRIVETVPADQAYLPLAQSTCPLVEK